MVFIYGMQKRLARGRLGVNVMDAFRSHSVVENEHCSLNEAHVFGVIALAPLSRYLQPYPDKSVF